MRSSAVGLARTWCGAGADTDAAVVVSTDAAMVSTDAAVGLARTWCPPMPLLQFYCRGGARFNRLFSESLGVPLRKPEPVDNTVLF